MFAKLQRKHDVSSFELEKLLRFYSPDKGILSKLYSMLLSIEQTIDWVKTEWKLDLGEGIDPKVWEKISSFGYNFI